MQIEQSQSYNLMVFMLDSADNITGKTGLTLSTIEASKAGAAFAAITPTVTERGDGWYSLALTSSHTDTVGDLALHIEATGANNFDKSIQVIDSFASIESLIGTPADTDLATDILNLSSSGAVVYENPVISTGEMGIVEGDTYDGTLQPKLSWTVSKDYTSHDSITLTIWRPIKQGNTTKTVLKSATASADSATEITVDMTATFDDDIVYAMGIAGIDFAGTGYYGKQRPFELLRYDLVADISGEKETVQSGSCYVFERGA